MKGFSPECSLMWRRRFPFWVKEAPHWLQWNGLSPAKSEENSPLKAFSSSAEEQPQRPDAVGVRQQRGEPQVNPKGSALDVTPHSGR